MLVVSTTVYLQLSKKATIKSFRKALRYHFHARATRFPHTPPNNNDKNINTCECVLNAIYILFGIETQIVLGEPQRSTFTIVGLFRHNNHISLLLLYRYVCQLEALSRVDTHNHTHIKSECLIVPNFYYSNLDRHPYNIITSVRVSRFTLR